MQFIYYHCMHTRVIVFTEKQQLNFFLWLYFLLSHHWTMWSIWRNMLASPFIYMTLPIALDNACYYITFCFYHACSWSLMTSYQKSMLLMVCGEEKPIWYNIGLLSWPLLPSLFNIVPLAPKYMYAFMYIRDNERVKGCLYEPRLILNFYFQIFSTCPGSKNSPISIPTYL